MISASVITGLDTPDHPLKEAFLKWQCRVRQLMMRDNEGKPDESIMPDVYLQSDDQPMGTIITILNKSPSYSVNAELIHMAKRTKDPADIRNRAMQFFSATYYQKHNEFSDILTATFAPGSLGAARIRDAGTCRLLFDAYAQQFDLKCKVWRLAEHNPFYEATMAHNRLFNPALPTETVVLGFEPIWTQSSSGS